MGNPLEREVEIERREKVKLRTKKSAKLNAYFQHENAIPFKMPSHKYSQDHFNLYSLCYLSSASVARCNTYAYTHNII
jgi:hypothetical protein